MSKVSTKSTIALLGALLATGAGLILYKNYSKNTRYFYLSNKHQKWNIK